MEPCRRRLRAESRYGRGYDPRGEVVRCESTDDRRRGCEVEPAVASSWYPAFRRALHPRPHLGSDARGIWSTRVAARNSPSAAAVATASATTTTATAAGRSGARATTTARASARPARAGASAGTQLSDVRCIEGRTWASRPGGYGVRGLPRRVPHHRQRRNDRSRWRGTAASARVVGVRCDAPARCRRRITLEPERHRLRASRRIRPIRWTGNALELLDQRKLRSRSSISSAWTVTRSPRRSVPRGARCAGNRHRRAWGVVLALRTWLPPTVPPHCSGRARDQRLLRRGDRGESRLGTGPDAPALVAAGADWREVLLREAAAIESEDLAATAAWASSAPDYRAGAVCSRTAIPGRSHGRIRHRPRLIRAGVAQGRIGKVFADETRPWMQARG